MYPITDCRLTGLSHTQQVSRLIEGGASLIQLREKHRSPSEFYDDASAALALAREHDVLLLINDRVDITLALGADGVHLGQYDMPIPEARVLLGRSAVIGVSTHTVGQAELATSLPIDYLAFGPVFPTASKEDHEPVAGLQQLHTVRQKTTGMRLVAIGGITYENMRSAFEAGADSVAVIGAVLSNPAKIAQNFSRLNDRAHL